MVMHTTYTNEDGLTIRRGARKSVTGLPRYSPERGVYKVLVVDFEAGNLPGVDQDLSGNGVNDSFSNAPAFLPAGSYITRATLLVGEEWDSAADNATLTIGLATKGSKGTPSAAIDADGIDNAIAEAALGAGAVVVCDGALVGGVLTVGGADAFITATTANNPTQGSARLIIEYTDGR